MICERVVNEELDPKRLENLFLVGVDEISYRKHQNYLTLVANCSLYSRQHSWSVTR